MRSRAVLAVAFITAAVAPVMAIPDAPHGTAEHLVSKNTSSSYGIGPALILGFCSETGACKRQDAASELTSIIDDSVQQGLMTQDEANALLQAVQGLDKRQAYMNNLHDLLDSPGLSGLGKRQEYMNNLHNLLNNGGLRGLGKRQAYMDALHGLSNLGERQAYMNNLHALLNNHGLNGLSERQAYANNLYNLWNNPGLSGHWRRSWRDDVGGMYRVVESGKTDEVDLD